MEHKSGKLSNTVANSFFTLENGSGLLSIAFGRTPARSLLGPTKQRCNTFASGKPQHGELAHFSRLLETLLPTLCSAAAIHRAVRKSHPCTLLALTGQRNGRQTRRGGNADQLCAVDITAAPLNRTIVKGDECLPVVISSRVGRAQMCCLGLGERDSR
jgi:hypothetical protein